MLVVGFPSHVTDTNCWVIAPGPGQECLVVDPGIGVETMVDDTLARHRLHAVAVLLTHGHFDHTFAVVPVCGTRGIPAYIAPQDRGQLSDPWTGVNLPVGTPLFGRVTFGEPDDVLPLTGGQTLSLAGIDLVVDHAPGHTPGSVTFRTEADLFSGDLIFAGSIGRTDFPGGSFEQIERSLAEVVLPLPDGTTIRPGHGPETTVGQERATNPFLRQLVRRR